MGKAAVALAKAVQYRSTGTVEFIVDAKRNFYFLEMNTRLQVEHPVTEMVTGLDLVELMIRIAAGEKLPFTQRDLHVKGWAIEARIYAEDPRRDFLPSPGRLVRYREPSGDGIRVDSGVYEGAEISLHYDPMIAKLAAAGKNRAQAAARLAGALDGFVVGGVSRNVDFLAAILRQPDFQRGRLSTGFIAKHFPHGFVGAAPSSAETETALIAAMALHAKAAETESHRPLAADWVVLLDGKPYPLRIARAGNAITVARGRKRHKLAIAWRPGEALLRLTVDRNESLFQVQRRGIAWRLTRGGAEFTATVLPPRASELLGRMKAKPAAELSNHLLSPMPGLLVSLAVKPGQAVKVGEELAVVEAMKMENVLRAERDGKVKALHAKPGDSLAADQIILDFA
jgi:propionyl-CoA carboxylase alpha chain